MSDQTDRLRTIDFPQIVLPAFCVIFFQMIQFALEIRAEYVLMEIRDAAVKVEKKHLYAKKMQNKDGKKERKASSFDIPLPSSCYAKLPSIAAKDWFSYVGLYRA